MTLVSEPLTARAELEAKAAANPASRAVPVDLLMLLAGSLALAGPFLLLHHVNTLDGPGHLLGGELIGKLGDTAVVRQYYDFSFGWVPNLSMQYMLAALTSFLSPTWAEKALVVGYVLGFPLAFRYAIRSVDRSAGWLALGVLPLTVNRPLLEGFYAFSYGMIAAVLAVGLAIRSRGRWNPWNTMGIAALLVVAYISHPIPLLMSVLIIAILTVADLSRGIRRARTGETTLDHELRRRALGPALAMAPAVLMTLQFAASGGAGGAFAKYLSIPSLLGGLVTLSLPVVAYSHLESISSVITVLVLVGLVLSAVRGLKGEKKSLLTGPLGVAFLVCVLAYLLTPNSLGTDSVLSPRLALFVPLTLLLACASVRVAPQIWKVAGVCFLVATLVLVGVRLPTEVRYDRLVSEFVTVERVIPRGATLLEVRYASFGPFDPLTHEASRVAADKGDVDLLNLEAPGPDYQETFRRKIEKLSRFLRDGHVNLVGYEKAGGHIDYVLVVGQSHPTPGLRAAPGHEFQRQLSEAGFVRVMVTHTGLVEVYRHR